METLRDELEFKNHKIEEYESMLQAERQRLKDMGQELQVSYITMFTFLTNSFWRIKKNQSTLTSSRVVCQDPKGTASMFYWMTVFYYFQGTLEKLDIQTETNNKLLAQQDKQQVSYPAFEL